MEPSTNALSKLWLKIIILAVLSYLLLLILSFDIFTTYQIIPFFLLLVTVPALVVGTSSAVSNSLSTKTLPSNGIIFSILAAILITALLYFYQQGLFYGGKLLNATFLDERSRMDLALYSDGHYIIDSGWMFGSERYSGTYRQDKESIIFDNYPVVDNDFVARTMIKHGNKIYFFRDEQGRLKDTSFYYFKINFRKE